MWETYKEFLKSDFWQQLRTERLKVDGFRCKKCNSPLNLNVHHVNRVAWGTETINDLITLCSKCHLEIEEKIKNTDWQQVQDTQKVLLNDFCEIYKHKDFGARFYFDRNGELHCNGEPIENYYNFSQNEIVYKVLGEFYAKHGVFFTDRHPYGSQLFKDKIVPHRWKVIDYLLKKGYSYCEIANYTGFSKNMIYKVASGHIQII